MKDVILPAKFRLYDKEASWETEGVTKYSWVNQQGNWCAVDDKKNLLESFTNVGKKDKQTKKLIEVYGPTQHRIAIQGEVALYNFLQAWLDKGVAFYGQASVETEIWLDVKKIFRNVDKYIADQFKPLIDSDLTGPFNALAIVNIREKDGKVNHYQGMYSSFWPDWKAKSMLAAINTGNWNSSDAISKTKIGIEKGLKKSAYSLGWLKPFDENEHQNAGSEVFRAAEGEDAPADENPEKLY